MNDHEQSESHKARCMRDRQLYIATAAPAEGRSHESETDFENFIFANTELEKARLMPQVYMDTKRGSCVVLSSTLRCNAYDRSD